MNEQPLTTIVTTNKFLVTKSRAVVCTSTWRIINVADQLQSYSVLTSPGIGTSRYDKDMDLQLLNKDADGYRFFIGLKLRLAEYSAHTKKPVRFSAWIIDADGRQTNFVTDFSPMLPIGFTDTDSTGRKWQCILYDEFLAREQLLDSRNNMISNSHTLLIASEIEILDFDKSYIGDQVICPYPEINQSSLADHFAELLRQEKYSDASITVDDKKFNVHRFILSARSPVFSAMFENRMREKAQNQVKIENFSAEVVDDLLMFAYTGRSPNVKKLARELLEASEQYIMPDLKNLCEVTLASQVTVENAAELLIISDMYNAMQLKKMIVHCIVRQSGQIMQTEGWKQLEENQPKVLADVTRAMSQYIENLSSEPPELPSKKVKMGLRAID
jgi:BTB/POZ domain